MVSEKAIQSGCDPNVSLEDHPGQTHGSVPVFIADQLIRIQALILSEAAEGNELRQKAMEIRAADWTRWMRVARCHLTMDGLADRQDMVMMDVERSSHWLQSWVEGQYLRLQFPETKRKACATAGLIRRWFLHMLPFVETIPRWFRFSSDEVMITISRAAKFVVCPGQRVFVEEKGKLPHFSIMPCFNPEGEGLRRCWWCRVW
jgi:hypothetical protein